MGLSLNARYERYCEVMAAALGHADRAQPARQYLKGLVLPGARKSVEPMAARVAPQAVRSTHQSMHHLVSTASWSDAALLAAVAGQVLPKLLCGGEPTWWIIDDTGFPKKGRHSVGVAHQYCGQVGKTANCQVAVSLSMASRRGSLPVSYRLYLPESWSEDAERCATVGVPESVSFATKGALARQQIEAALDVGHPRGTVLADAAYGDETGWREWLASRGLTYAVGVRPACSVWWGAHQPVSEVPKRRGARGKQPTHLTRDAAHPPISVAALAHALPAKSFRSISWSEGSTPRLTSRFARVRVRAAHRDVPRDAEWLVIEWPSGASAPTRYWLSNLPESTAWRPLIETIKARWRIERDYQELKQELGLGKYEGRNWRGFHHHASLCIAAYGFLIRERLTETKKNPAGFKAPPVPEGFQPRGHSSHAATRAVVDRDLPISPDPSHQPIPAPASDA